jgi:tryptophan-rich sensory protein
MPAWVMHRIMPGTRLSTPLIQLRFNWQKSVLFITIFYTSNIQASQQGATLYTIQLGLNLAWMPIFFGLERPIEATVDILALGATAGYLTYVWSQVDEVAAWTMVPYLGWICFATYLCVRFKFFTHSSTCSTDA